MNIINLTPHKVSVENIAGKEFTFSESGFVARANYSIIEYGMLGGDFIVSKRRFDTIDFGIEKIEPYTIYIVSEMVMEALQELDHPLKHQFIAPNTFKCVKDSKGKIKATKGFIVK